MTIDAMLNAARSKISRYDPAEARKAARQGAVLVDLRCAEDRNVEGSLPDAIPIPRTVLEWRADPSSPWHDDRISDPTRPIILVCNDGYASSLAAASLTDLGFDHAGDVVGGFRAWKAAGLPIL